MKIWQPAYVDFVCFIPNSFYDFCQNAVGLYEVTLIQVRSTHISNLRRKADGNWWRVVAKVSMLI